MDIKSWSLKKTLPYILIICGLLGLISASVLSYDVYQSLINPNFKPNCNINPVLSCGSVMDSKQGTIFGFPNPIIGLVVFPILAFTGITILAGAKYKKWFWAGLNIGLLGGIGFILWLFFQSIYRIQAVCPYCALSWFATITAFWYVTLYNYDQKLFRLSNRGNKIASWIRKYHLDILVTVLLIIAALILKHFWWYYGKYF